MYILKIGIFVILYTLISCARNKHSYNVKVDQKQYSRDSAVIAYQIAVFISDLQLSNDFGCHFYSNQSEEQKKKLNIYVDTIIYNQEKDKFFTFVIIRDLEERQYWTLLANKGDSKPRVEKISYDGFFYVGLKDSMNYWKLYSPPAFTASGGENYEITKDCLYNYYFNIGTGCSGSKLERDYSYGLDEIEIWDSKMFRKSLAIPSLYDFQVKTEMISPNPLRYFEIPYPVIEYPDNIRAKFRDQDSK